MAKIKLKSLKKLHAQAWKLQSEYVRRSQGKCLTCGKKEPWQSADAGHFVHGQSMDFEPKNIWRQCLTEHSKIRMEDGTEKTIKELKVGDGILAFDDKLFKARKGVVEETDSFLSQELYQVELENGAKFIATPNHKVVANGEWRSISEMLHSPSAFDILEI